MSSLTMDELEVFILTYNRPKQLRITLESILSQTVSVKNIVVLDNGMFPGTKEVIESFSGDGISYYDSTALGQYGNVETARKIASKKYLMLLHDDDAIRPDYLEMVLEILKKHPAATLVTGYTQPWPVDSKRPELPPLGHRGYVFSQREFATFLKNLGGPSYSLAVYRTDTFRRVDVHSVFTTYGKWGDGSLMVEAVGKGEAVVSVDVCGWMGTHPGQDTNDPKNLPSYRAWLDREKFFLDHIGDNPLTFSGFSFCLLNYCHLRMGFKKRIKKEISFRDYMQAAKASGAATAKSSLFRWISTRPNQKLFLKLAHTFYYNRRQIKLV